MQLTVDKGIDLDTYLADEPHTLNLQGPTCSYQSEGAGPGSSRSICGLAALNYARLSLALELGDDTSESPLLRLASAETIKDTMSILEWNELRGVTHLNVTELLEVPFFQETLSTVALIEDIRTLDDLEDLFQHWFPKFSSQVHAAVFSGNAEALVCLSFSGPYSESLTYSVFDLHSRSDHRGHPAVTFSSDLDDVTARIHSFLSQSSKPSDKSAQGSDISAHLLELKEGRSPDFKDVLARSATYISRRQMGADDTAALSFVESDHISQLRLRAERLRKVRSEEYSNPEALSDIALESRQKRKKHAFGPRRTSEYGWQLSLLLESNFFPITISEDDKETDTERKDEPPISSAPFGDLQVGSGDGGRDGFGSSSKQKSEYSWLTSIVRKSSTHADGPLSQGSAKEPTPNHPQGTEEKDGWQMALSQQLQEEEELSASFSNIVSSDRAWLVTLQKQLQAEDSNSGGIPPLADRLQLDWHLAVQLQQELFWGEDRRPAPNSSSQRARGTRLPDESVSNRSWVTFPETASWIRLEDTTTFNTIELPRVSLETRFECGICVEMCQSKERVGLAECDHKFCKECLTTFVKTKIEEHRYPIFCPECVTMHTHTTKSQMTQDIIQQLDLNADQQQKLEELQLLAHSVTLDCPRCRQTMRIDREQYGAERVIVCPLPLCGHKWCKTCLKTLASSQENHRCKNNNIDRLMKKKGWKYCPGCQTPVQKESGCNHITCGAPGCNTHFCYRCGVLMIDTTNGGDVGTAVTEHYLNCRLFEKRLKCSIQ